MLNIWRRSIVLNEKRLQLKLIRIWSLVQFPLWRPGDSNDSFLFLWHKISAKQRVYVFCSQLEKAPKSILKQLSGLLMLVEFLQLLKSFQTVSRFFKLLCHFKRFHHKLQRLNQNTAHFFFFAKILLILYYHL